MVHQTSNHHMQAVMNTILSS